MVDVWSTYDAGQYISLAELATLCNCSIDRALETLDSLDIQPSGAHRDKKAASYLYDRMAVIPAVPKLRALPAPKPVAGKPAPAKRAVDYDHGKFVARGELAEFFPGLDTPEQAKAIMLALGFSVAVKVSRGPGKPLHLYYRSEVEWAAKAIAEARSRASQPPA